jgi:hypothetical protein
MLALIGVALVVCWLLGAPFGRLEITRRQVIVVSCSVLFLWIVALFLSIVDHFRYGGWELCDGEAETVLKSFATALLNDDLASAYQLCSVRCRDRMDSATFERAARKVRERLGASRHVLPLDEPGRWKLPILAGAVQLLDALADDKTEAVGLVLLGESAHAVETRFPALRARLTRDADGTHIDAFDVVEASLNQA